MASTLTPVAAAATPHLKSLMNPLLLAPCHHEREQILRSRGAAPAAVLAQVRSVREAAIISGQFMR
jgi:hypothetical protein